MSRDVPASPAAGLKRDPALVPLSRDHHFALRQVLWMRRASAAADLGRAATVARDFLAFHRDELVPHMADEEEALFGRCDRFDREGTERLRREHREIDALTARLRTAAEAGEDLRPAMAELASLLDDHIRYEERAYFMTAQERLDPGTLAAIGAAIGRRRLGRRAPSTSAPG
jgi:hemerythrin-like domain-containing protein